MSYLNVKVGMVMWKKLFLVACMLLISISAYARDCTVSEVSVMYLSPERFVTVFKMFSVNQNIPQLATVMAEDVKRGEAVVVPAGTKCQLLNEDLGLAVVVINGTKLIAIKDNLRCR